MVLVRRTAARHTHWERGATARARAGVEGVDFFRWGSDCLSGRGGRGKLCGVEMELLTLKGTRTADNDDGVVALKAPVDPASLVHGHLRSGPFWQKVPAYADVTEEKFLD